MKELEVSFLELLASQIGPNDVVGKVLGSERQTMQEIRCVCYQSNATTQTLYAIEEPTETLFTI